MSASVDTTKPITPAATVVKTTKKSKKSSSSKPIEKRSTVKLDKGLNLNVFETINSWRQINGLKHDDYTRYRRFCTRRLKRLRQKVGLVSHWKKTTSTTTPKVFKMVFNRIHMIPEYMKTGECLMIPLLNLERCWAYANDLTPADETEGRKGHHQLRRIHKMRKYCDELLALVKGCNKRTQREVQCYVSYIRGTVAFECKKYEQAVTELLAAVGIVGFITKDMSEEAKFIFRDILDDCNAKVRVCKEESPESENATVEIEKWRVVEGEAQVFNIPDDTMRDAMKTYRESKSKPVNVRMDIIQKVVVYCNKIISNRKIENRMLYKDLLDFAFEEKYQLTVEEILIEINTIENLLGKFSLVEGAKEGDGKIETLIALYNKLAVMEKKRQKKKEWRLLAWSIYKDYYHSVALFNQKKLKESFTNLKKMTEKLEEATPLVEGEERKRIDLVDKAIHVLSVQILMELWKEKSGSKPVVVDVCADTLTYPSLEKKGWFNWW
ncbi:hypothetical protein EIN_381330 [Entamoeba invadens IP1]|uniref:Signal recognition particle subunit SRP68 n=2 Tax=Entamoeba invadens TaxID=33085 RepID=A0A0A1UEE8_ENTIV|nr:hypothetical protein EIN_381330 [Entamoeba invadens IP1]ELP92166.1 hypothetical protein EIN_381330 [Entamoeba invadens IP1]BAN42472.1 hypothetical protein [Entamoeba invadens]|eukprot:XP_004258937.1 hypothetical protein EIN_381330 [Entamoeba invadens IP1]